MDTELNLYGTVYSTAQRLDELVDEVRCYYATTAYVDHKAYVDYDYIIKETEQRILEAMERKYRELKADRLSLNMTEEEFEQELETLIFGRVINNE